MAKQRQKSDDSVRYDRFVGLDVNDNGVKSSLGEGAIWLSKAMNVNITRKFGVQRRSGFVLWKSGNYYTLWGNGSVCYGSTVDSIVSFKKDATSTTVVTGINGVGVRFADAQNGVVYWSNGARIGKLVGDVASELGTSSDQFKITMPAGDLLSFYSPYLLVVKGRFLYISDPINRDVYHRTQGFIAFKSNVRMVAAVGKTLFISDNEELWSLQRINMQLEVARPMFRQDRVRNYPAIVGDNVRYVYGAATDKKQYPVGALFATERGLCIAGEDGGVEDLSEGKYNMPAAMEAAYAETLRDGDLNLYIAVIKGA